MNGASWRGAAAVLAAVAALGACKAKKPNDEGAPAPAAPETGRRGAGTAAAGAGKKLEIEHLAPEMRTLIAVSLDEVTALTSVLPSAWTVARPVELGASGMQAKAAWCVDGAGVEPVARAFGATGWKVVARDDARGAFTAERMTDGGALIAQATVLATGCATTQVMADLAFRKLK